MSEFAVRDRVASGGGTVHMVKATDHDGFLAVTFCGWTVRNGWRPTKEDVNCAICEQHGP